MAKRRRREAEPEARERPEETRFDDDDEPAPYDIERYRDDEPYVPSGRRRFPPAEWRTTPSRHEAARRARPYRWPFAKEPFYDGDDAIYGPHGYESAEEGDIEEAATPGSLRARTWRKLERAVPPSRALAYPEIAPGSEEEARLGIAARRRREHLERTPPLHSGVGPKGYRRSDERIFEDIAERLMADPLVDPSDVEVRVENGEVILTGTVRDRWTKHEIENLTDTVAGVTEIHDQIRVERAPESARS